MEALLYSGLEFSKKAYLHKRVYNVAEDGGVDRHTTPVSGDILQDCSHQGLVDLLYHLVSPDVHSKLGSGSGSRIKSAANVTEHVRHSYIKWAGEEGGSWADFHFVIVAHGRECQIISYLFFFRMEKYCS